MIGALEQKVDGKIDALDQKMDRRFEVVDQRFAGMGQRLDSQDRRISLLQWTTLLILSLVVAMAGKLFLSG